MQRKKEKVAWEQTVFFHKKIMEEQTPVFKRLPPVKITFLDAASGIKKEQFFFFKVKQGMIFNIILTWKNGHLKASENNLSDIQKMKIHL